VRHEVNRGAVVISPTPEKVEELYAARERLETAAVARPAGAPELEALRKAYEDLVEAAASHDVLRIVDVDLAFHATIVSMLHSSRINDFYGDLLVELRFYLTVLSLEDREFENPDDILTEHREILEAIESGDASSAAQHVRTHIERNAKRVLEILHGSD
jgi:DNA-binding GntR family transcriptional regulator